MLEQSDLSSDGGAARSLPSRDGILRFQPWQLRFSRFVFVFFNKNTVFVKRKTFGERLPPESGSQRRYAILRTKSAGPEGARSRRERAHAAIMCSLTPARVLGHTFPILRSTSILWTGRIAGRVPARGRKTDDEARPGRAYSRHAVWNLQVVCTLVARKESVGVLQRVWVPFHAAAFQLPLSCNSLCGALGR